MSDGKREKVIRVTEEIDDKVRRYAAENEISVNEAVDRLVTTGLRRLSALSKYTAKRKR